MRIAVLIIICMSVQGALAQEICTPPDDRLTDARALRARALQVLGRLPTPEELADPNPGALLDQWLDSDAFAQQAVRHHVGLLWPNPGVFRQDLGWFNGADGTPIYFRRSAVAAYRRQGPERTNVPEHCADRPAEWDADGNLRTWPHPDEPRVLQEGWVDVQPVWSAERVRICAFDAQSTVVTRDGTVCDSRTAYRHPDCGCGAGLERCYIDDSTGRIDVIGKAMRASFERQIFEIVRRNRPYLDLFTAPEIWVNGPLSLYYRHLTLWPAQGEGSTDIPRERVPIIPFAEHDTWRRVPLPAHHAGIFSHFIFLTRFTRNRARATHVLQTLLCQPLQPPAGGLPAADPESARDPDLQRRDGCKYCHAALEPAAAYFARWEEGGANWLDPEQFPLFSQACQDAALGRGPNRPECSRYIGANVVPKLLPLVGFLKTSVFLTEAHQTHIDAGPAQWMRQATVDGRLPRCTAQRASEWLLGRPLDPAEDAPWLDTITRDFVQGDLSYRALVRRILTDARFERVQ